MIFLIDTQVTCKEGHPRSRPHSPDLALEASQVLAGEGEGARLVLQVVVVGITRGQHPTQLRHAQTSQSLGVKLSSHVGGAGEVVGRHSRSLGHHSGSVGHHSGLVGCHGGLEDQGFTPSQYTDHRSTLL